MKNLFSLLLLVAMSAFIFTACSDASKVAENATEKIEEGAKKTINVAKDKAVEAVAVVNKAGKGYQVGDKAADFKLKNIDGKEVSLADMTDAKGFIVTFTCNHCPTAQAYEQRLKDIGR